MKLFKCLNCGREHQTDDKIKISFCRSCLTEMKEMEIKGEENGKDRN